jgi:hypothetical protein
MMHVAKWICRWWHRREGGIVVCVGVVRAGWHPEQASVGENGCALRGDLGGTEGAKEEGPGVRYDSGKRFVLGCDVRGPKLLAGTLTRP